MWYNEVAMRKALYILPLFVLLVFSSGCAEFKTYMKNRGNDLADCFTVRGGLSFGLGVRAQVTNYVSASVGGSIEKVKVGYFGRDAVKAEGIWFGPPVLSLVVMYAIIKSRWIDSESLLYFAGALSAFFAVLTDYRTYENGDLPEAASLLFINVTKSTIGAQEIHDRMRLTTPLLRKNFFLEAGATLGVVSFDVGFNPVELVDFLLSWFGIDITGDDKETVWDLVREFESLPVGELVVYLKHEEVIVRVSAARILARKGDKSAVEPLVEALKDEDSEVRSAAIEALGKICDKKATKPLIEMLKHDKDEFIRLSAAKALGDIGDKRAIGPLIEKLKDKKGHVHFYAIEALKKITDQEFGEDYDKWKQWHKKNKNK